MRIEQEIMVALRKALKYHRTAGYGKYFRSDSIVGLEPIEEERGPGKRTKVYIDGHTEPIIASRTEGTILRDLVEAPAEVTQAREHTELHARAIARARIFWKALLIYHRCFGLLSVTRGVGI